MKQALVILLSLLFVHNSFSQIGIGTVSGFDFYQRYKNPVDDIAYPASGNALLNIIYGPKIWVGGKKFSVSIEGHANIGLTSLALKNFKGMGAVSFPVMAKLNFKGLSGFNPGFSNGFSIGGGIQWSKTELYWLSKKYKDLGVERGFYDVIFGQIDIGIGSFGSDGALYVRYGFNPDNKAKVLNIGMIFSSNKTFKNKMKRERASRISENQ
jgi:hypothetical protein